MDLVLDEAMTVEREQQPSTLARSRNEKLLNDLVLDRPGNSMVRWLLLTYFLDDWARVGRFKIFLARIEEGLSDEKVLKRAKRIFKACLVRRGPRSFPGRSWTLADEGPAWCCCLLGFHGVFLPFYRVFCYLLSADDPDAPLPPGIILLDGVTSVGPTLEPGGLLAILDGDGDDEEADQDEALGGRNNGAAEAGGAAKRKEDPERQQSRFRTSVLKYHDRFGALMMFAKVYAFVK